MKIDRKFFVATNASTTCYAGLGQETIAMLAAA